MNRFGNSSQSRPVAIWLFACAAMVFAMVVIGGITRLTGSGLSITEWKPIMGALPPLNAADWSEAFEKYKAIPQYAQVNAGMSMADFQSIFWWEWAHRLFGRLVGAVFALPFFFFLACRLFPERSLLGRLAMPTRLIWRCALLLAMGGMQGVIGWWMVSSGLSERVDVAPERLTTHLGLALLIFAGLIWTALEAWSGEDHNRAPQGWSRGAAILWGAVFIQCLLGGLVAGAKAGFIYTDWPLMNGALLAPVDWGKGGWAFLHDQALVQFNHRIWAYGLLIGGTVYAVQAWRWKLAEGLGTSAFVVGGALWMQALLGIVTLISVVPLWLGGLHQAGAAIVLALVTANLWMVRRSQPRLFMSGPRR
ncbi:COX15/CtaA family protein [Brevundimonas subvibrioides]|uniref:Heme A synthase n=1 Tax=Brevundimonas subvibrioides (strain ATCC 15264 / DSM 4735 / LMG 14903 / NBRC 16000 / CB 81) TaxID=633149 RepID=D9QHV6_BRESC|nr:COX15/CtaA family protein [Brevundimonas subvibrioides]ADL01214.1 cytochrome oxidase assembly [Brevundimonas subvibrioides ATCC 15264]